MAPINITATLEHVPFEIKRLQENGWEIKQIVNVDKRINMFAIHAVYNPYAYNNRKQK